MSRQFRSHDAVPDHRMTALHRMLCAEWVDINARDLSVTLRSWGRRQPALRGFGRPGEILDTIDQADPGTKDAILLALIVLFQQHGSQLAGRVVLQAFLPAVPQLRGLAHRTHPDVNDIHHEILAEFWTLMGDYPVERRTTRVATNLLYGLRRALGTSGRTAGPDETWDRVAGDDEHSWTRAAAALSSPGADVHLYDAPVDADCDLWELTQWAVRTGVITRESADLIRTVYTDQVGPFGAYGYKAAAAQLGISEAAARQRCSRACRQLIAAVQTYLHQDRTDTVTSQVA